MGYPSSKRCPDCKMIMTRDPEEEVQKDGWRNMRLDATGPVIVPGGNIMQCLADLCAYEELCDAAGIHGPEELKNLLGHLDALLPQETIRGKVTTVDVKIEYVRRVCDTCGHYQPDKSNAKGSSGICDKNPRKVRSNSGGLVEVPGEFRRVVGTREPCKDWTRREDADPSTALRRAQTYGCQLRRQSSRTDDKIHNSPPDCCAPASRGGFDGGQIARATENGGQIARATGGGQKMTAQTEGGEINAG